MKSYKELLTEMLKPVDAGVMCKLLKDRFSFKNLNTRHKHNGVDEIELLTDEDERAHNLFFSRDYKTNKENIDKLDKFLNKFHWYVNQINNHFQAVLLQQRDVHDFSTTTTSDPTTFADGEEDINVITSNIKDYGFIHVSSAPPEVLLKTGLRPKSSQTFDKHDERRIYLFSLAPQFLTNRENIVQELENGNTRALLNAMTDSGTPLAENIAAFAKERRAKYVYLIKKLQKPAKLYKDNAWTDFNHRDAIYTKDYAILPQDIQYVCETKDLFAMSKVYNVINNLTSQDLDTAVDRLDFEGKLDDKWNVNLNADYKVYVDETFNENFYLRRIVNLASKLLVSEYNVKLEPKEVLYLLARNKDVLDYVAEKTNTIAEKIEDIRDTYGESEAATQRIRRIYANFSDFVVANVLEHIDYKNNKKRYR